ncbi:phage tail tape measure protein [Streptomyces sp. LS1784]|uniref:phage tail tape measure protein n=1 Tax=Streptomyces sp. LS1784 TaxID=2851533 RepID=UPI001CCD7701|nr:phage tail tape measure protein [Streptomyces sp. LS1784]
MPTVGYASLQIVPSVRGIGSAIRDQLTGPVEQAGDDAGSGFGKRLLKGSAVVIAAGAAAVGALLVKGLGDSMEQGKITGRLGAQLGATGPEAERYGHIAGQMWAGAITEDVQGAADAVRATMSAGLMPTGATEQQIQSIATKVADLSSTFEVDLGQSANAAGQMIKTGLAKDGAEALDVLTRGFQVMGPRADDLGDTFNEYSVIFQRLGLSATAATGLLSQGMQAGARDTDVVADALKEFVIEGVAGGQKIAQGFKDIGLNADQMIKQLGQGGPQATQVLQLTLDKLRAMEDPVKRDAAATELFGTKAEDMQKSLLALNPATAVAALGDVAGAADRMGTSLRDNAATKLEKFTRGLEQGLTEVVGGKVLPALESVGSALASRFGPAFGAASDWITGTAVPAAESFGRTVLDTVVPAVTRIGGELADRFGPVAEKAGQVLRDDLAPAATKLGRFLRDDVAPPVIDVAKWLGQHLVPAAATAAGVVVGTLVPALADTARWLSDNRTTIAVVAGVITAVLLPVLITTAVGYAQAGIAATISAAQQVAAWVTSGGAAVTNSAMSVVASYQTVGGWIAAGASAIASGAQQVWAWVTSGAAAIASGAQQAAAWITIGARIVWGMALQAAAVVEIVAGWVLMGAQSLLQAARMAAAWVLAMGPLGWVIAAVVALVALVVANWDTVRNATVEAWNWVSNAAVSAGRAIVNFFTGWNLAGVLSRIWSTVYDGAVNGWNATINWIRGVPGWIRDGIGSLGDLLVSAGGDVVRGLWRGISSMGSWLKGQLISFATNMIPGPIAKALGIASPSKVMRRDIGRWIPAGIEAGVEDGRTSLDRTMAGLVQPPDLTIPAWSYQAQAPMGPAGGGSWAEQASAAPVLNIEQYYESPNGGARQTAMDLMVLSKGRG